MKGDRGANILIVHASRKGNTSRVAHAVADALRDHATVTITPLDPTGSLPDVGPDVDLLVIGGPTEGRAMTGPVTRFLDQLPAEAMAGRGVAVFDTRLAWPRWLSGSAAADIAGRLRQAGAELITEPESFLVDTRPELAPGELDRARRWAVSLIERLARAPGGTATGTR